MSEKNIKWIAVGSTELFFKNMGSCIKIEDKQISIFNRNLTEWYAVDNMCPHKKQMVLSRGIMGSDNQEPKVSCPLHKRNFSLTTGICFNDDKCEKVKVYPIKVTDNKVFISINE